MQVTSSAAQVVIYSISCTDPLSNVSQAQAQVAYTAVSSADPTAPTPAVTLTTNDATQSVGNHITLNWSSQNASVCMASGGSGSDGWSGSLSVAGQMSVTESSAGEYTFAIACSGAPPAASAQVQVEFASPSASGSASGGGGGGALQPLSLLLLALLVIHRGLGPLLRRHLRPQEFPSPLATSKE